MRPGDSITLGGFLPDTAQRLRADLGTAADERHFNLRKCSVVAELLQSCLTLCDLMGYSRPGCSVRGILQARSRQPFPSPGDLPDPGMKPVSFTSPALGGRFFTTSATWEAPYIHLLFSGQAVSSSLQPQGLQHTRLPCPSLSP